MRKGHEYRKGETHAIYGKNHASHDDFDDGDDDVLFRQPCVRAGGGGINYWRSAGQLGWRGS